MRHRAPRHELPERIGDQENTHDQFNPLWRAVSNERCANRNAENTRPDQRPGLGPGDMFRQFRKSRQLPCGGAENDQWRHQIGRERCEPDARHHKRKAKPRKAADKATHKGAKTDCYEDHWVHGLLRRHPFAPQCKQPSAHDNRRTYGDVDAQGFSECEDP